MSEARDWCLPDRFWAGVGASCTFKARPKEPRNEELSLMTKAPGSSFLSSSIAGTIFGSETVPAPRAQPPSPGPEGHQTADVTGSPFVPRKSLLLSNLRHCCCMRSAGHGPSLDLPLAIPSSAPTHGPDLIPEPRPLKHFSFTLLSGDAWLKPVLRGVHHKLHGGLHVPGGTWRRTEKGNPVGWTEGS